LSGTGCYKKSKETEYEKVKKSHKNSLLVIPLTAYPAIVGGAAKRPTQREERVFITLLFYGKQRTPASDRRPDLR
jgi:hypothetical protein